MNGRFYDVYVDEKIGTVVRRDVSIAAARAWARRAFGPEARVSKHSSVPRCSYCNFQACICPTSAEAA